LLSIYAGALQVLREVAGIVSAGQRPFVTIKRVLLATGFDRERGRGRERYEALQVLPKSGSKTIKPQVRTLIIHATLLATYVQLTCNN
jgi:hypothetical protein